MIATTFTRSGVTGAKYQRDAEARRATTSRAGQQYQRSTAVNRTDQRSATASRTGQRNATTEAARDRSAVGARQ